MDGRKMLKLILEKQSVKFQFTWHSIHPQALVNTIMNFGVQRGSNFWPTKYLSTA